MEDCEEERCNQARLGGSLARIALWRKLVKYFRLSIETFPAAAPQGYDSAGTPQVLSTKVSGQG
jgi:hypothetical protein